MSSIAAPSSSSTSQGSGVSEGSQGGSAGGSEAGKGEGAAAETKRAVSRITSVLRCVWDAVRVEDNSRGLHVLVQPPAAASSASSSGKSARESAEMQAAVEKVLGAVCHAELRDSVEG